MGKKNPTHLLSIEYSLLEVQASRSQPYLWKKWIQKLIYYKLIAYHSSSLIDRFSLLVLWRYIWYQLHVPLSCVSLLLLMKVSQLYKYFKICFYGAYLFNFFTCTLYSFFRGSENFHILASRQFSTCCIQENINRIVL